MSKLDLQNIDLSRIAEDGTLKTSMKVIFWYMVLARGLIFAGASLSSPQNGELVLHYLYPSSEQLIVHLVFALIVLIYLQVYVFAAKLKHNLLQSAFRYFREVSIFFIALDAAFTGVFLSAEIGWFKAGLLLGLDLLAFLFFLGDDYLKFYISYYKDKLNLSEE